MVSTSLLHQLPCVCVSHSLETPWTTTHKASLSMEFFRQEYWSQLPFLSPGDLPDPGIKLKSLRSNYGSKLLS